MVGNSNLLIRKLKSTENRKILLTEFLTKIENPPMLWKKDLCKLELFLFDRETVIGWACVREASFTDVGIFLLEKYRSRGNGLKLLRSLLTEADNRYDCLEANILPTNRKSIKLFEKLGFIKVGVSHYMRNGMKIETYKYERKRPNQIKEETN